MLELLLIFAKMVLTNLTYAYLIQDILVQSVQDNVTFRTSGWLFFRIYRKGKLY